MRNVENAMGSKRADGGWALALLRIGGGLFLSVVESRLKVFASLFTVGAVALCAMRCPAATWYVAQDGRDSNAGTSEASPFATIQTAIDNSADGDEIVVGDGIYAPITTANKKVSIRSVNGAEKTFIDGGSTNRCAYLGDSTNQVNTTLTGFTLKNGNSSSWGAWGGGACGGFVRNCVITNCVVSRFGGGAYGAVLEDCILVANQALHGGGCYDSIVRRCRIVGNHADDDGGGARNVEISDSVVIRNQSRNIGGGVSGTALCCSLAYNCTIVSNITTAGAVVNSTLYNCIVTGNLTSKGIVDDFEDNDYYGWTNKVFSCWTNAVEFLDAANDDFRLSRLSEEEMGLNPCVNAGNNAYVASDKDLAGRPRIVDSSVDIGAYEFDPGEITYKLRNHAGEYDGVGHTIEVTQYWPTNAVISYSLAQEGPYQTNSILITNVCEQLKVWFVISAEGCEAVTNFGTVSISSIDLTMSEVRLYNTEYTYFGSPMKPTVLINGRDPAPGGCQIVYENNVNAGTATVRIIGMGGYVGEVTRTFVIKPRTVQLRSVGASKVYDGLPLVNNKVRVSGNWFAPNEGAIYSNFASITEPGWCSNTFSYALKEGTLASNYVITQKFGSLTVGAAPVVTRLEVAALPPWGLVADYVLEKAVPEDEQSRQLEMMMIANGVTNVAESILGETNCVNGAHRVYWNMAKDNISVDRSSAKIAVRCKCVPPPSNGALYCVIDLAGGANATEYPVSYLNEPPEGGFNTTEYKTTKLVLRRCLAGKDPLGRYTLTKDFYAGLFEVTQRQWSLVIGYDRYDGENYNWNYDYVGGDSWPANAVSYEKIRGRCYSGIAAAAHADEEWPLSSAVDATSFMGLLRAKTGIEEFDLPTEAQWEYACRAGTRTKYSYGDTADGAYMWYSENRGNVPVHEVGTRLPNPWGLYDMHGNLEEWCLDRAVPGKLGLGTSRLGDLRGTDPVGLTTGDSRVLRGGSVCDYSSSRGEGCAASPVSGTSDMGFRLFMTEP